MKQRTLGKTGLKVSQLALGGLFTSELGGGVEGSKALLRRAFDLGINFIDTAPAYANSEETLGQALHGLDNLPDPLIISTKLGGRPQPFDAQHRQQLMWSVEESLKLLKRDTIDLLLIHEPDRPQQYNWWSDPDQVYGPVIEVLDELKEDGVIKYTGVGGTTVNEMHHVIRSRRFDVLLTAFNYSVLFREAALELIPTAAELGMGVIVGSALQQGALGRRYDEAVRSKRAWMSHARQEQFRALYSFLDEADMSLPQVCLRFAISHPAVSCVLTGAKTAAHIEESVAAVERGPLPLETIARLDRIAAMVPYRPFEEPMLLPFGKPYFGPGIANLGMGVQVGKT